DVFVDGQRKDAAPAIISGLPAGDHIVEVKKDGFPPWRQTVTVPAGQQVKVAASFGAATNSSLRIISNEPDVEIFVDGESKGKAPVTLQSIKPGEHIVGGRKTRFKPMEQTVRVAAGENAIVSFRMEVAPPDRPRASLKVQSQVPNAEVFVDGSSLGRAPIDRNDLDPGKHYIVVHKDGFTDFKREVVLLENQAITMVADLAATGSLRVLSSPEGADVKIDGELIGKTPVQRDAVASGDHIVEFKLKGFFDHKETMKIEGGREKVFSVDLKALPSGPSPEQVQRRKQGMSSFGAKANPVGGVTADFGLGYPYYVTVRLMVGAVAKPAIDVGVEFQTFFNIANLALAGKMQLVEAGPFSLAVRSDVGGGTGTNGRDTYFFDAGAIASLAFSDVATVNGSMRYSLWSDKFCPTGTQISNGVDAEPFCTDSTARMGLFNGEDPSNGHRFTGQRLYFGIGITAAIDRFTSFFFQIEGLPFADQLSYKPRLAFMDAYNGALIAKNDHFVYGMAGISLKF
ncbi:MAG TPA: PEGA domain-containing protein, partial [Polyangia bacterium]|nr:PEGA domain-containing protein [Polyangia bacterium]